MYVRVDNVEVKVSNPEKELYPGISKWMYIKYLGALAAYLLPYCQDRLLTIIRYPDGVSGKSFYQKHVPTSKPSYVKTKKIKEIEYIILQDTATLIWLGNLACLEFHVSFHTWQDLNSPTELVFDLDPTNGASFEQVKEVALVTREILLNMGLDGFVKTSGATGLQIYVPIQSTYTFEETRLVNQFIADYLVKKYPKLITIERRVKDRGNKVYFDYLQHWRGKTLIAPYSPRATLEATISTPVQWEELQQEISPKQFTFETIFNRLETKGDIFQSSATRYDLSNILSFIQSNSKKI